MPAWYEISVTKKLKVTPQDIDDIVGTALDSGISYWCRKAEVIGRYMGEYASDQISRGGSLMLYDAEDEEGPWELNLENLLCGIEKAIEGHWFESYGWYDDNGLDTSMIDADVADTIIQLALFEDVIFG